MDPTEVLKKHLDLCNDVHQLLLEENTWLKVQKKVQMKFLDKRKSLFSDWKIPYRTLKN